jgi:REP element-mobilizing transposase RayT
MPRRQVRFQQGGCYHIYNRGHNCQPIFFERDNYIHFLRLMHHHLVGETLDLLAYCLMPNHYHFLVQLKEDALSPAMHRLIMAYSKAINRRYQRVGTLFQGPFRAIAITEISYLYHLVHYIHANPVKAHLVDHPKDWEFSSYPEYANLRNGKLPNPTQLYRLANISPAQLLEERTSALPPALIPLLLDA